jgi:hypothetical protein
MIVTLPRLTAWGGILLLATILATPAPSNAAAVSGGNGRLRYEQDARGNRVPDFSSCGYAGADREIPTAPVRVTVAPGAGDDGARIQAALDQVAAFPLSDEGLRGAVVLASGQFEIAGRLRIAASGVVLRGAGALEGGTTLVATGDDRRTVIRIAGVNDRRVERGAVAVADDYVPAGALDVSVSSAAGFAVGDAVLVSRPSTREWVRELGCDAFGVGWRPGSRDVRWDRRIVAIQGDVLTLDAPITTAIDATYGGATVAKYAWSGRIENVGVEDLRIVSEHDADLPMDEDHAWFGVTLDNARDAWVRRVAFVGFAGGAVATWETTSRVTVEDCAATEPVSEIAGWRRQSFFTQGQQTLFLRCWADQGRQDFCVGHCAPGPNAFVNCVASRTHGDSGPIESWASGVLYDNVRIDGGSLILDNRWTSPPGAGWSAANCVLWNVQAAKIRAFKPPTANNWVLGAWAIFAGDGHFEGRSDFASPVSLYQAQLRERVGDDAAERIGPLLLKPESSTNPPLADVPGFVARSHEPARQLIDVIKTNWREAMESASTLPAPSPSEGRVGEGGEVGTSIEASTQGVTPPPQGERNKGLRIHNGWLVIDGKVVTGGLVDPQWWAGNNRPDEAPQFGPNITRFIPGHVGPGLTTELAQVASDMQAGGKAVYEHHYGLWYDLRRADHLHSRQEDASCAVPFYEQPFARTGVGTAWDGLSKYDLTKFNTWYWQRLRDFAELCDERGLVLVHQNYFQHNILEAGAHWVDCPWRPVNNVNDTGFSEPPPFIGDKRIFIAHQFYDVTNEHRPALHRGYIRQCLDGLAEKSNVIQMTSAEYSGPLEFTQFWIDVVAEWEAEKGRDVIVGLSAPKDVQDAILADEKRAAVVDVIDIRYWAYTAGGGTYAPGGGLNLAPRQHLRQTKEKPGGFGEIARAVQEYRTKFPGKAVTYFAEMHCPSRHDGWAVLMGGGSLADVRGLPAKLAALVPTLAPLDGVAAGDGKWCLGREGRNYLIASEGRAGELSLTLPVGDYQARWINPRSGEITDGERVTSSGGTTPVEGASGILWLSRVDG